MELEEFSMSSLSGKIVLLIGGATGIGQATAHLCSERGATVVVADIAVEEGRRAAAKAGGLFVAVDIADEAQVAALAQKIAETYDRVDVLIHTAGILLGAFMPLETFSTEIFRRVMDVNVTGTFLVVKHIVPLLKKSPRGVVILTSSGGATAGSSSLAYGSSKGGVNGFAVTLTDRLEAEGLRVNVLSPGNIDTPMKRSVIAADARNQGTDFEQSLAAPKLGSPEGVAKILAFLASDDADYVRGIIATR
jgi:NAD(P)-dependent dehydrogenase (short-subunit alcohol dehydrogenase family)